MEAITTDPVQSAKEAGLRYVADTQPGIRRIRSGKGFRYIDADGSPVRDPQILGRIKSLVIPPAWKDVWICSSPRGHLQATGRDARGRKQARYHPRWREVRDETKYERMLAFGAALPAIREQVNRDLALPGLPRRKVLATVVRLMETTCIRVGNVEYARENHSYGLTTMRNHHVNVDGSTITFKFQGKSGIKHTVDLNDRRIAKIVKRCQDIPGYELFQYEDSEGHHSIDSADVNEYLKEISGQDFTAKDFRTWAGTVLACTALRELAVFDSEAQAKKNIVQAIDSVAERLGNTRAVCRKCYIHPAVLDCYLAGAMAAALTSLQKRAAEPAPTALREEESILLHLLEQEGSRAASNSKQ
ncbi:MAG TPA: DNA topoisomerase IB [Silvibacterium sp.]|nr:DNA topoisomerase IB [Silvibacterium sp.]